MKNLKKLSALVLALVMALSLCVNVVALDGNEVYLSPATGTEYTTITNGTSAVLEVFFSAMGTDSVWYHTGFDSETQAENISWRVQSDPYGIVSSITRGHGQKDGLITATATVNLIPNKYGVAIIEAAYGSYTLNLTVCAESSTTISAKGNITVEVIDVRYDNSQYTGLYAVNDNPMTVAAISTVSGHAHANNQANAVAQSFPTAFGALCQLVGGSNVTIAKGYVDPITAQDSTTGTNITLASYLDGNLDYYSWYYRVIRNGSIAPTCLDMSAGIFELQAGDQVVWAFGSESDVDAYFDMLFA